MTACFIICVQADVATGFTATECKTVGSSASRCVCYGEKRDDCAENSGRGSSASGANEWIAGIVIGLHGYGRHGQVGAVDGDGCGLCEARPWVGGLDGWMDRENRDSKEEDEIHGDGGLVHAAAAVGEEDVHDDGHGDASQVHAEGAADENPTPHSRVRLFDLLDAVFGEGVCQVDQQDQSQEEEQDGAAQSDIISPHLEEAVGDEEAHDDQSQPHENLGTPPAVLNPRSTVLGRGDAEEEEGEDEVEEAEREVDAVHGREPEAVVTRAVDGHVVEEDALELVDGPWSEQYPREERVEEEDEGVGEACGDRRRAFTGGAAQGGAGRRAAAGCAKGEELWGDGGLVMALRRRGWRNEGGGRWTERRTVPMLGSASSGRDRRAPILSVCGECAWLSMVLTVAACTSSYVESVDLRDIEG